MATTSRGTARGGLPHTQSIKIPADVLKALDAAPDVRNKTYPSWHDDVIRKYYGKKPMVEIARVLKRTDLSVRGAATRLQLRHEKPQ